jgi:aspartate aminotransferase
MQIQQAAARRDPAAFLASRVVELAPSPTIGVSDRARQLKSQGIDVVDLGGGDPDFITPEHIRKAAAAAMDAGDTHYVASPGTPPFRKAIAEKLRSENGIEVDWAKEIIVTPGAKAALFQAILALVEPGVDVLLLEPAWVSYAPMIEMAGGRAIPVKLETDDGFRVSYEKLAAAVTPQSRALLFNSPNNPTGRVLARDELDAIARVAVVFDLLVLADDMYEKILFDGREHVSIASLPGMRERTLTFNGLSKAYAMTGWRLGYVAGPAIYVDQIAKVHSHSVTCATSFAQAGGVAALTGPQGFIGEMVAAWDRRRRMVSEGLSAVRGFRCPLAEGAFYAFPDIRELGMSSIEAADKILKEAHVALVPGIAFGEAGEGHLRLSFATSDEELEKAVQRIGVLFGRR